MKQKIGISLIVLVITIIVIIILSGAIIMSLTDDNLIAKAKLAKESNDWISIREMVDMEKYNMLLNGSATISGVTIPAAYTDDIIVSSIGGIFLKPNVATKISDIGNALDKLGAAYMPTGFEHVTGTLDEGIVIKNTADGNEFVWVPVPDITKFYLVDSTDFLLFNKYTGTNYKSYNTASTTETAEYNGMVASVTKYKGFYIARYEAGKPTGTGLTGGTTTGLDLDGTDKPISKANMVVWNNIAWDLTAPPDTLGNDTHNGIVKVARTMYPLLSATTVGMPVSTLIYGEQWDAAMRYMKDVPNILNTANKYITDSTGMGNYTGTIALTASNSQYKVKNIYDMGGNASEWTMETFTSVGRAFRGRFGNFSGSKAPAAAKGASNFLSADVSFGFRPALYIK